MSENQDESINGGLIAAKILARMPKAKRERIMESISERAPEVLRKIETQMVSVNDITKIATPSIQSVLNKLTEKELALITAGAAEGVRATILQNVSDRKLESIKEELHSLKAASLDDHEAAQRKIVKLLEEIKDGEQPKTASRIIA